MFLYDPAGGDHPMSDSANSLNAPLPPVRVPGLALVVRRAPNGAYTLPMDDPITEELYGYSPEALRADAWVLFKRMHPDDLPKMLQNIEESRLYQNTFHLRWRYNHPTKGWRWLEAWSFPRLEPDGSCWWRGFAMDITHQAELEEAVREKDQRLREAFEQAAVGMALTEFDGRIFQANAAFATLLGCDPTHLIGVNILDLTHPEDRAASITARSRLWSAGTGSARLEKRFVRADDHTVWTQVDISLVVDTEHCPRHFVTQAQDITARKEAEARLRASEEKFSRAFSSAPMAMVFSSMADGVIQEVNSEYCHLTGYPREELVGSTSIGLGIVQPEARERLLHALHNREAFRSQEIMLRAKDGTIRHVLASSEPIELDGSTALLSMLVDHTEKHRAELAMRASEERLQLLIDHAPASLAMFDRDMRYLAVSQRWLDDFHIGRNELLGRSHYEVFPEIPESWKAVHKRGFAGETIRAEEDRFVRQDGSVQWLRWEVRPWMASEGVVGGIVIFSEDITPRREAEESRNALQTKLVAALDNMTDAVSITDTRGSFIDFNEAFAAFHRFDSKFECSRSFAECVDLLDLSFTDGALAPVDLWPLSRALRGESASNAIYHLRRKDTGETWVGSYSFAPIRDAAGAIAGSVVVARDITEQQRLQQALFESESRYRAIFESSRAAMMIFNPENGFIEDANAAAEQFYGWDRTTLMGMRVDQINTLPMEQLWPLLQKIRAGEITRFETSHRVSGGKVLDVEAFVSAIQLNGRPCNFAILHDITERKEAETEVRRQAAEMDLFFRANLDLLCIASTDGRFLRLNPEWERVLGYPIAELEGVPYLDWVHPDDRVATIGAAERLSQQEAVSNFVNRYRCKDGSYRWLEWKTTVQGDKVYAAARDITDRLRAEAVLRASEERFQRIFRSAPVLLTVSELESGAYLDANRAFCDGSGYSREEILGKSAVEIGWVTPGVRQELMGELQVRGRVSALPVTCHAKGGRALEILYSGEIINLEGRNALLSIALDVTKMRQAERAVQESAERFRQISEAAEEWIWEVDADGVYTYASPVVERLLGYRPEELVGRVRFHDLWPEDTRSRLVALAGEVFQAKGSFQNLPNACVHKDGHLVLIETTGFPILGPDGSLQGYRGTDRDVTEREKNQEALRRSQERFEKAFQSNPIPMAIAHATTLKFLEVNDSWVELTGVPREDAVGHGALEMGIQIEASGREAALQQVRATGFFREQAVRMVRRDGKVRDLLVSGGGIELAGEPCVVTSTMDVTEQRKAEVARLESEQRFREFFEHSPVAVWEEDLSEIASRFAQLRVSGVTDLQAHLEAHPEELRALAGQVKILSVNAASLKLMGVDRPDDLIRELPRYFTDKSYVVLKDELSALFQGATRFEAESPHLDHRGRVLDLQLRLSVLPGHETDLSRVLVSFVDLTDRKAAEAERQRMERELNHLQRLDSLGRLASGVSHDMNNVLGAIMAVGSLLKARHKTDPIIQKDADMLLHASERGRDLVKGLRDFSRKELDSAVDLDLNEVARREADLLERTSLKKVEVVLDLAHQLPLVFGEAASIQNALMNLCLNSIDAMPHKGRVTLATRDLGQGYVELSVEDDGEGMPPEVVARALEPFFTTKPMGKGTGLGLSQVYGTVKAHGGTLDIQSKPGIGTRISMNFPYSHGLVAVEAEKDESFTGAPRALNILLVDDEELIRGTVYSLLEVLGHHPQAASSGLEALRRLEAGMPVDLLMLDINMPGMDGVETLSRIRILRPDLPVLFATGHADERIPDILKRFPKVRILKKPFHLEDVRRILAGWV